MSVSKFKNARIGSIIEYENTKLEVVENMDCSGCYFKEKFNDTSKCPGAFNYHCFIANRSDEASVAFKEVK